MPVHKKDQFEPGNFRPICMQSCFSKVIEKATIEQLKLNKLENFDERFQFAYKENTGCVHPVLLTRHLIEQELQKKKFVILLMIDLSLAFDTIETENILPYKLKYYGADQKTVEFFKSFFCNRKQFVEWNGTKSETVDLYNLSICQGSSIGPPTFNHYVMDLNDVTNCHSIMFADDTNYIISSDSADEAIKIANIEL